jgi:hypothetical protein
LVRFGGVDISKPSHFIAAWQARRQLEKQVYQLVVRCLRYC